MNHELEIWRFVAERLRAGDPVILLVVAQSTGSSPGRQGFKMAVTCNDMAGSIGGGVMEVAIVNKARDLLCDSTQTKFSFTPITEQVHRKHAQNASGMICSGRQTIASSFLLPEALPSVELIIESLIDRSPGSLTIGPNRLTVSDDRGEKFRFTRDGPLEYVYEERLGFKNKLYIVGGGHCALALSEVMSRLDFDISIFDDRPELNTLVKNRFAEEIRIIKSYEDISDLIPNGQDTYVAVMTLGYKFDEMVIRALIDREFNYFGVLGSRAKMKALLADLAKDGISKERLDQIRTPIGLPINSQTPEEIAVSIAAEIIAVKNGKGV